MIFVGTLIASDYIIVEDKLSYLWAFLLQIPVSFVVSMLAGLIVFLTFHGSVDSLSTKKGILCALMIFSLGIVVGIAEFYLVDMILPGLTIHGAWTYILLGIVYGMLSAEVKTEKKSTPKNFTIKSRHLYS